MKISRKYKLLCGLLGLGLVCGSGMVSATSGTKTVQAVYRNINVSYNNTPQTLSVEPFAVNGSVYVPLRAVGDMMGVSTDWKPETNTVYISGSPAGSTDASTVATYLNQIQELSNQLAAAQKELNDLKSNNNSSSNNNNNNNNGKKDINNSNLNATANTLYSNYSDGLGSNIDLGFELTQKASRLQLKISYGTSSENTKFDNLTQSKIKSFIQSVCDEVVNQYGDIAIQGSINYDKSDNAKVTFALSTSGKYTYEFAVSKDDIQNAVLDELNDRVDLGKYGYSNIDNVDVTLKDNKISFNITLRDSASDLNSESKRKDNADWNTIQEPSIVRNQLKNVVSAINNVSNGDYTVSGEIYTRDNYRIASISTSGEVNTWNAR